MTSKFQMFVLKIIKYGDTCILKSFFKAEPICNQPDLKGLVSFLTKSSDKL